MQKWLCVGTMVLAALLGVVFLLDLLAGIPFSGDDPDSPFTLFNIFGFLGSLIAFYLGLNAYKDNR